jgi:hypothetical protein
LSAHPSGIVAHHDAPLNDKRAANVWAQRKGGDERAGMRRTSAVRAPALRTGSNGANLDASAATRPAEVTRLFHLPCFVRRLRSRYDALQTTTSDSFRGIFMA